MQEGIECFSFLNHTPFNKFIFEFIIQRFRNQVLDSCYVDVVLVTKSDQGFDQTVAICSGSILDIEREVYRRVEKEFRAQIEKILSVTKADHIDSHCHTHAITPIFKIVCKLAKEYGIPYVRTQYEEFYVVPQLKYILNYKFAINILKIILLNLYTFKNRKILKDFGLKTNNYLVGVGYTGMMDEKTLEYGLKTLSDEDNIIVEALIHPCSYLRSINDSQATEFKLTQNKILEDNIYRMGYEITNHKV